MGFSINFRLDAVILVITLTDSPVQYSGNDDLLLLHRKVLSDTISVLSEYENTVNLTRQMHRPIICTSYRPQRSCGKVMFSQASVILLTGEGISAQGVCVCGRHPLANTLPGQTPPCSVHAGIHTHPCPVHAGIHPPADTAADGTHPTGMHSS